MTTRKYETAERAVEVLKNAVWLAWVAAGGPQGMGVFQDKPTASKEEVWDNAYNCNDYSGDRFWVHGTDLHADYVFGRMLKLNVSRKGSVLEIPDHEPRTDYQSWCGVYKSFAKLFDCAENFKE